MGMGSWNADSYANVSVARSKKSREEVFQQRSINKDFDPKRVVMRESCDSDDNPNSTAIIIGLDVTGSMGMVAEKIAKKGLGTLVESIHDRKPVTDPHIMMMAIGDINCDRAPLQVTQFEADLRISDQIVDLWLEGGGGGNRSRNQKRAGPAARACARQVIVKTGNDPTRESARNFRRCL